jgi:hypothetical protein
MKREIFQEWVLEALKHHKGEARLIDVCKYIWLNHERDLRASGDLFYTWQYDVRWAATKLRHSGKLVAAGTSERGVWRTKK